MRPLEEFLDKTNLEDRVLEAAANGDVCNTAHWLRQYKDVVKMYGLPLYDLKEGKERDKVRKTYHRYLDMYMTFKKETEEILGERLQL